MEILSPYKSFFEDAPGGGPAEASMPAPQTSGDFPQSKSQPENGGHKSRVIKAGNVNKGRKKSSGGGIAY